MYLLAVTVSLALAVSVATLVPIGSRKREGMLLWALGLFLYALTGSVALAGKGRAESVVGVDLRLPGCRTAVPLA